MPLPPARRYPAIHGVPVTQRMPRGVPRDLAVRLRAIADKALDLQMRMDEQHLKFERLRDSTPHDEWAAACDENGWSTSPGSNDAPRWGDLLA